ncbi:PASTA domain-containing protein [Neptuniibacter pectenicola]|uniref:PASTA domain-containing protein n=1 Tax=Neptuniibacter pectenicola TaxID=1806669 RepID=UPI000830722F|nr:PASTA domain-containing protein [Neptuniibacter pectenicola]
MALTITAKLLDSNGKALNNATVDVCFYAANGRIKSIASGKTLANGQFKAQSSTKVSDYLPRVLLRTLHKNNWLNLTNTPKSYSSSKLDFGNVKVSFTPVLTVANTIFHTIPSSITGVTTKANPESLKQLNTLKVSNQTLEKQLQASKKAESTLKLEIDQLRKVTQNPKIDPALTKQLSTLQLHNKNLTEQLKGKENRIKELERIDPNAKATLKTEELSKDEMISSAMAALNKADHDNNGRFQLKSARMDLKVLPGSSKDKIRLVKDSNSLTLIDPAMLSTLILDLDVPGHQETVTPHKTKMPDLTGYTRSLANRRLEEMQLDAQWYNQQLTKEQQSETGKIISQAPKAGAAIDPDTEIMLIIGVSPSTGA